MKFGQKPTRDDKMKVAASRVGGNAGATSAGKTPALKPKVQPVLKKGTVGIKITKKF